MMQQCILLASLLLSLVQVSLAIKAANCSTGPGIDCIVSGQTCGEENSFYERFDETYSHCDPLNNAGYLSHPSESQQDCEIAENGGDSTVDEGAPLIVNVSLHSVNYKLFDIAIQWSHSGNAVVRRGYQVTVIITSNTEPSFLYTPRRQTFCVPGKDARNLTLFNHYRFSDMKYYHNIKVEVVAYPLPIFSTERHKITGIGPNRQAPHFCNDIGPINCNPPRYDPPNNVELRTLVYNTSEGEIKRLDVHWDPVTPFSEPYYQRDQYTVTYYIRLYYYTPNPDGSEAIREHHVYKVNSTRTDQLLISLLPLNCNVVYTELQIGAHFPCAGISFEREHIGCGNTERFTVPFPVPLSVFTSSSLPTVMQPTSTIMPQTTIMQPSSTLLPQSIDKSTTTVSFTTPSPTIIGIGSPPDSNKTLIIALSVVIPAAIVFIILLVFIIVYMGWPKPSPKPSLFVQPQPPPPPNPYLVPQSSWKAVVVYSSLCDEEEVEYILANVVQVLNSTRGITVSYPDDGEFIRECVVSKLEDKVKEADAVLIVCNEAFENDWKERKTPLVNALRQLVASSIGRGTSNKFAVVVFDNEHRYIPSSFLSNLSTFNIGEIGKDQTKRMMHFVTGIPLFELTPPKDPISPQSVITMRLCDTPEHCLEVDLSSETTMSTSVSSHNSLAIVQDFPRASIEPA